MNAHVISPSLKDFVRYQVGSEMSLLRKVLPRLCPFSANSIVVLLNRNESCRLCSRWDSCRKLFYAHLGVASCRAFLYLSGVWCWELSHTGTSWAFQLKTDHPVLLTMVPHHLLGNKTVFHWGMLWNRVAHKKSCMEWPALYKPCIAPNRNATFPSSRKPGCLFGWHAGVGAGLGS